MGDSIRKCIEKWQSAVRTTNASSIKSEIENLLERIGNNEKTRSTAALKIYSVLVNNVTLENASNLVEIFKYLKNQSPSYIFPYFIPVLFNKMLELERAVSVHLSFFILSII